MSGSKETTEYLVEWALDIEAESPEMAAKLAAADCFQDRIAYGEECTPCVFEVTNKKTGFSITVDLSKEGL